MMQDEVGVSYWKEVSKMQHNLYIHTLQTDRAAHGDWLIGGVDCENWERDLGLGAPVIWGRAILRARQEC